MKLLLIAYLFFGMPILQACQTPNLSKGSDSLNIQFTSYTYSDRLWLLGTVTVQAEESGVFVWLEDEDVSMLNDYGRVRKFFFTTHGDFSLQDLILEGEHFLGFLDIGRTFCRYGAKGKSLRISFLLEVDENTSTAKERMIQYIDRYLVMVESAQVNEVVRGLDVDLLQSSEDEIVVPLSNF